MGEFFPALQFFRMPSLSVSTSVSCTTPHSIERNLKFYLLLLFYPLFLFFFDHTLSNVINFNQNIVLSVFSQSSGPNILLVSLFAYSLFQSHAFLVPTYHTIPLILSFSLVSIYLNLLFFPFFQSTLNKLEGGLDLSDGKR